MSLAWFGAAFYAALLALWLAVSGIAAPRWRFSLLDALLWLTLAGLTFSLGLMYVQFALLHAFCPLCTASAAIVAASVPTVLRAQKVVASTPGGTSSADAWTLALFAVFPSLILIAGGLVEPKSAIGIAAVDLSAAHRAGPINAPVQILVYSDFQCSFCRQLTAVLQRVRAEFPNEATVVYRHFPLAGHPRAFPAAVASECAAEQGAFWEYHDKLFSEGGELDDAKLVELAASLKLDQHRFTECLQSAAPKRVVEANLQEATELGLPGAPSLFINGHRLEGMPTYENVVKRIKEQLAHVPGGKP